MVNPDYNNHIISSNQDVSSSASNNVLNLHSIKDFSLENLATIKAIDSFIKNDPGKFKFEDLSTIQQKLSEKITELTKATPWYRTVYNFIFRHHIYAENKEKLKSIEDLSEFIKTVKPSTNLGTRSQINNPLIENPLTENLTIFSSETLAAGASSIAHQMALEQVDETIVPSFPGGAPPPLPPPGPGGMQANLPKPKEKMFENEPEQPSFDYKIGIFNKEKVEKEIPIIEKYIQDSLATLGITKPKPEKSALLSRPTKRPSTSMPNLNSNREEVSTKQEVRENKSLLDINTIRQNYKKAKTAYKSLTIDQILKEKRENVQKNLSYILMNLPLLHRQSLVQGSQESGENFAKRQKEETETIEKQAKTLEELEKKMNIIPSTIAESMEEIRYLTEEEPNYTQILESSEKSLLHLNKLLQKFKQPGNLLIPIKIETKNGESIVTEQIFYEKEADFEAENKRRIDLKQKPLPKMYLKNNQVNTLMAKKKEMEVNVNQVNAQVMFIKMRLAKLSKIKSREISLDKDHVKLFDAKILKLKNWESGLKTRRNRLSDLEKAKQPAQAKEIIPDFPKTGHDLLMKSQLFSVAASKGDISQYFDIDLDKAE